VLVCRSLLKSEGSLIVPTSKSVRRFILAFAASWTLGTVVIVDRAAAIDDPSRAGLRPRVVYHPPLHPAVVASLQVLGSLLAMLALDRAESRRS
jgi:hypothetical protein